MRITTIFWTSLALASSIIIGWSIIGKNQTGTPALPPNHAEIALNSASAPDENEKISPAPDFPDLDSQAYTHLPMAINPALKQSELFLNTNRPLEALAILSNVSSMIDLSSPEGKEWLRLLVGAYASTDNTTQLVLIYNQFPEAFNDNQHAAFAIADTLIEAQNLQAYDTIRQQWAGKETEIARWVFLDAQAEILNNHPQKAAEILQANHFKGDEETDRLVRLAALHVVDDPKRAWEYLSEATQSDPHNPDLRTFKASISEGLNQTRAATSDYIVAVQHDPENPYRREQLADFYIRSRQYKQALEILEDTMSAPSLDSIWLKTLFWSHLTIPVKGTWKEQDIPQGRLKDLVSYISNLPDGIYWDPKAFEKLPEYQVYLNTRQETFWLQLLSALKNGQEEKALQLLNNNTFQYVSWAPDLEKGLKTLLDYNLLQKSGQSKAIPTLFHSGGNVENPEQLLQLLVNLSNAPVEQLPSAIPYQMQDLLRSKEVFALPFLAIGWTEAALQLHATEKLPESFPSWVAESITKAIKQNRDSKMALSFALKQSATPSLSLLIAELALEADEKQIAFNNLKAIYTTNDQSGRRAAVMLGQFLLEHDNLPDAKKAILAQSSLTNDAAANEILARIALQEGDLTKAYTLYLGVEKQSSEAKSFLARKAFVEREWTRARQLTEALLKEHPDNSTLKENLQRILAEEKKQPAK